MKLPHRDAAVVAREKITGYLLSPAHRDGRGKHDFFVRFGFSPGAWETLRDALLGHAAEHEVTRVEDSPFGTRYVIEGTLAVPDGRGPLVRAVWFIEEGESVPRLVTAYPVKEAGPS
jgi:hypothetical protein